MRRLALFIALTGLAAGVPAAQAHHGPGDRPERVKIVGTSAGETLTGTSGADWIRARGGDDTVLAGAGDDVVDLTDRSGGDRVDCGDGNDTVWVDSGDLTSNCETVKNVATKRCARKHTRKARAAHHRHHGRDCRGGDRRRR